MCCDVESYTCIECEIIRNVHISVNVVAGFLLLPLLSHNSWGLVQEMMPQWFATYSAFIAADHAYCHADNFHQSLNSWYRVDGTWTGVILCYQCKLKIISSAKKSWYLKSCDKVLCGRRDCFGGRQRKLTRSWTKKARISRMRKGMEKSAVHQGIGT